MATETQILYETLDAAYAFFNGMLFDDQLPTVVITLQSRKKRAYGYYRSKSFVARNAEPSEDGVYPTKAEIALNCEHFLGRSDTEILSTLVHEMCHVWQDNYGKPSRTGYHNKEFARKMLAVGLICSQTGAPDGKQTGQQMTHYVDAGGGFELQCRDFLATHSGLQWASQPMPAKTHTNSKVKYTCPECGQNTWAKPDSLLLCGYCSRTDEDDTVLVEMES